LERSSARVDREGIERIELAVEVQTQPADDASGILDSMQIDRTEPPFQSPALCFPAIGKVEIAQSFAADDRPNQSDR
jgi:hypothetical protein